MADAQEVVTDADMREIQGTGKKQVTRMHAVVGTVFALSALYIFLVGLGLLGDSFKCLGGRGAGNMFTAVDNPVAGLMVGVLATVLVQSSSTSTSIVVGLVGADAIPVRNAIPIIMGANIGTSITNTIVSLGQIGNRIELQRAFSGATVHDMFNFLSVAVLLPIEIIVAAINGEGGLLYWITKGLTDELMKGDETGDWFESPIKTITSPIASEFISNNKHVISALSFGAPKKVTPDVSVWNSTVCTGRRLTGVVDDHEDDHEALQVYAGSAASRSLLSRRLPAETRACTDYYCVHKDLNKTFYKLSKSSYKQLESSDCKLYLRIDVDSVCTKEEACFLDGGSFYKHNVEEGPIIKGGFLQDAGDVGGGIIGLIFALLFLVGGLFGLVKALQSVLMGTAKRCIIWASRVHAYVALVVGVVITILVQSSSVTTSTLTPLCGMGLLRLEQMLPLTLGANIGTTVTGLIAALADLKPKSMQIALCHLLFNIIGILIWFPVPVMRQFPLGAAQTLGLYAANFRFVPGLYVFAVFVILPLICLGVSTLYSSSMAGGLILTLALIILLVGFVIWWWFRGCYRVLSKEARKESKSELAKADEEMMSDVSSSASNPSVAAC